MGMNRGKIAVSARGKIAFRAIPKAAPRRLNLQVLEACNFRVFQKEESEMAITQEMERNCEVWEQSEEQDRLAQHQLQTRLRIRFGFAAPAISTRCSDGILVIDGHVDCFYHKQMAQELARSVPGVQFVDNRLIVDSSRTDRRVHETFRTSADHVFH